MFRYDILQETEETEQIHLIFIIHFILNAPKPQLLHNSFVFTFCHIHVGSTVIFIYVSENLFSPVFILLRSVKQRTIGPWDVDTGTVKLLPFMNSLFCLFSD